jgi:Leucine-rich repeat (LRR) protein
MEKNTVINFMQEISGGNVKYWLTLMQRIVKRGLYEEILAIKYVDCYNESLKNIPSELMKCSNITHLNLNNNKLQDLPNWIADFEDLHTLTIDKNEFRVIPEVIFKLKNLKILWITNNPLDWNQIKLLMKNMPKDCNIKYSSPNNK